MLAVTGNFKKKKNAGRERVNNNVARGGPKTQETEREAHGEKTNNQPEV